MILFHPLPLATLHEIRRGRLAHRGPAVGRKDHLVELALIHGLIVDATARDICGWVRFAGVLR